jgi:nitronate monooxygenase
MSFFNTRITELFGIEYPIIQGGMAAGLVSTAELASAVGNAGGIGFMCAIQWLNNLSKFEDELKKTKDLTDKPFGVNVTLFPGIDQSWFDSVFDLIEKYEVPALETSARSPAPQVKRIKQLGVKWIHKVARVRDGVKAANLGADAMTIIGSEEGGHPGAERNATSVVGPLLVDRVDVPVAIGGGFCDGRGLVTVLALGGEAVYMGTRFCASEECVIHSNAKQALVDMEYNETDYIFMSLGDPVRCVRSSLSQEILQAEEAGDKAAARKVAVALHTRELKGDWCLNTGEMDTGIAPFGMVGGRIDKIEPVAKIIDDIVAEADEVLAKLAERKCWKAP